MNFLKLCMAVAALLSAYVFIVNYQILDVVYIMKARIDLRFPTNFWHKQPELTSSRAGNNASKSKQVAKEPTELVLPTYDTYNAMIEDDTHASNKRTFPGYSSCPYQGLRKPFISTTVSKESSKCRRRALTPNDCKDITENFGQKGSIKPGKCKPSNSIKLCTIAEHEKVTREQFELKCNASLCKEKGISLGLFSDIIGKIKWQPMTDVNHINKLLKEHVLFSEFSPGFALLKCEGGQGIQVLSFPKILKRVKETERLRKTKHFNINIVVEDSVSRAHFYRTLLKTASTFKDIIYNQSIPSTLLEFEKVQSYASNTYLSLQRLFAGQKYLHSEQRCDVGLETLFEHMNGTKYSCTYGIEDLLTQFKSVGYSTLLQEDHCWYDDWGSFLDPRRRVGKVKDEKTRLNRWKTFAKIAQKTGRAHLVDDYGISFLTCDAYAKYKVTNPFSSKSVPNVCFAGRHYASLFLEYAKEYAELNDDATQPYIAYTHLLTSHDTNGRRIVNDDESLAEFFRHAAHLRNTLTIFASDHGAKSTHFAAYTTQGRQEVFQPPLFMIIPHEVGKFLGAKVMNALVVNQNRLVGVEDLHDSLVSIVEPQPKSWWPLTAHNSGITRPRGLFTPVPLDRTCEQMKLNSDVLCLCDGMDKSISNDSYTVLWAAEYALGTLNNRIQEQYTTSQRSKGNITSDFYGYGACQRYMGTGIASARHIFTGQKQTLYLSLLVKPFDRKTIEIFDVELTFSIVGKAHGIGLNNLIRVSPFNEYEQCTDKGVDPKLCACHPGHSKNLLWRDELYSKVTLQKSFNLQPKTQYLDNPCLAIISRSRGQFVGAGVWQNTVVTYEALNACVDVTYELIINFKRVRRTRLSITRPRSVTLLPRTVTFLMTAENEWKYGKFIPIFKFEKRKLTR